MTIKKALSVAVAVLMLLSCLPIAVFAAEAQPAGTVYISFEDYGDRDYAQSVLDAAAAEALEAGDDPVDTTLKFPEQFGVIIEQSPVEFYEGETVADAVMRFLASDERITGYNAGYNDYGFYMNSISFVDSNNNAVADFGDHSNTNMSGWMVALNGCTGNALSYYAADDGDIVRFMYSCSWGEDIGASFYFASAVITGVNLSTKGCAIAPDFSADVKAYELLVPAGTESVKLNVTTENLNDVVTYSANGVEYKYMRDIPVEEGTVITVNSKYYGYDYDTWEPYLADEDEISLTVVFVEHEPASSGASSFIDQIASFFKTVIDFFRNLFARIADFFKGLFN